MKRSQFVLTILSSMAMAVAVLPATAAAGSRRVDRAGGWSRVWSDNFNGRAGTGVNPRVWKYNTGQGVFGTGEIETMTNSTRNVHLDGHGNLDITALGHGRSWTSGRIQTISSDFGAPAGGETAVTASIRQPNPSSGLGYWPAFWMLGPGDWPATGENRHSRGCKRPQRACGDASLRQPERRQPGWHAWSVPRIHRALERAPTLPRLPDALPHLHRGGRPKERSRRTDPLVSRRSAVLPGQ